jgi:sugar transferase (PEP-CTERM system associated)
MTSFLLHRFSWRTIILIGFESVLIIGAVFLAAYVRFGDGAWFDVTSRDGVLRTVLIAFVVQVCLYYTDLYDLRVVADRRELVVRTLQALGVTSLILAVVYFWFPALIVGRGVFMLATVLVVAAVMGWRVAFAWLSRRARPRERLLLVGTGQASVELARELHERREELGVDIIGFVDPAPAAVGQPALNPGIVGAIEDIPGIVQKACVDRVVVSLADARGKLPMDRLLEMKLKDGVRFDHLASVYEEYTGKIAVENLRPSWLIFSEGFRRNRWLTAAKRASDAALAAVGLLVALPVMLVVGLAVKMTSPGPVLYRQQRVGQHGRVFTIHKFRSMLADAEAETGAVWSRPDDARVTPVGRFLRRTRLDEFPQLMNVLLGDMSFVGPRPERPEFVAELTQQIPFYGLRHVVKPGITGWAQVRYTYAASVVDAMEKLQYDLFYIKNLSIALDAYVLLETIKTVLVRRGS